MTNNESSAVRADELRVDIQAGEHYETTPRLKAALDELAEALLEAEELDTGGFGDLGLLGGFSLVYRSPTDLSYTENDSRGKKRGIVEYSWNIEEGNG